MNDWPPTLDLRCGPIGAIDLTLFAAASGDHNPLHLDDDVARGAGFDRPVVHGMLTMACAGRLFESALGRGCVRTLQTKFTGVAQRGDALVLKATLDGVEDGVARYAFSACTEPGREVATGQARVARPA
jgi:acyl dehydratase